MDCWDFKETRWTPKDLDVTEVAKDLYISRTLFPQLSAQMNRSRSCDRCRRRS